MNTDNLTDEEIALYLGERIENDDFEGFYPAAMDVVRDPDMDLGQILKRIESCMVKADTDSEVYDRVNEYKQDLLDLMDEEIDDLETELSQVRE